MNPVTTFAKQMVPMMMVLASYIGSMLLAVNLEQASLALASRFGKWQRFSARQMINLGTAVVVSFVGVTFVSLFTGWPAGNIMLLWGFQALFLFAFMSLAQIPLLLIGPLGAVVNIFLLSSQLVSSGSMVPRELLSGFYQTYGNLMPATYAVEGLMNLMFGGPSVTRLSLTMLILIIVLLAVSASAAAARQMKKAAPKPVSASA